MWAAKHERGASKEIISPVEIGQESLVPSLVLFVFWPKALPSRLSQKLSCRIGNRSPCAPVERFKLNSNVVLTKYQPNRFHLPNQFVVGDEFADVRPKHVDLLEGVEPFMLDPHNDNYGVHRCISRAPTDIVENSVGT